MIRNLLKINDLRRAILFDFVRKGVYRIVSEEIGESGGEQHLTAKATQGGREKRLGRSDGPLEVGGWIRCGGSDHPAGTQFSVFYMRRA